MRLFLAINLPPSVIDVMEREIAPLRDAAPTLRWVKPEHWHLTVRFLGEQPIDRVPVIRDALDDATAAHGAVPLALGRVGAFPNMRRARVVWVGVAGDPRLEMLHHDVELACVALGLEPEGRPFRPHVTVARVPDGAPEPVLRELARIARTARIDEVTDVRSVDLMASELSPEGPRYRLLHSSPLAATV